MKLGKRGKVSSSVGLIFIVLAAALFFYPQFSSSGSSSILSGKPVIRCSVSVSSNGPDVQKCIDEVTTKNKWQGAVAGCAAGAVGFNVLKSKSGALGLVKGAGGLSVVSPIPVDELPSDAIPIHSEDQLVPATVDTARQELYPLSVADTATKALGFLGGPEGFIVTTAGGCLVGGIGGYFAGAATADLRAYLACPAHPHLESVSCRDTGQKALICPTAVKTFAAIGESSSQVTLVSDRVNDEASIPLLSKPVEQIKEPIDLDKLYGFGTYEQTICTEGSQIRAVLSGPANQLYDAKTVSVS